MNTKQKCTSAAAVVAVCFLFSALARADIITTLDPATLPVGTQLSPGVLNDPLLFVDLTSTSGNWMIQSLKFDNVSTQLNGLSLWIGTTELGSVPGGPGTGQFNGLNITVAPLSRVQFVLKGDIPPNPVNEFFTPELVGGTAINLDTGAAVNLAGISGNQVQIAGVPEPGTIWLIGMGAAVLILRHRLAQNF